MTLPIDELKKRFRSIKLIVSDIDGTLVSNDNQINEFTKQQIKDLLKKNIHFSLASQRVHSSIIPIAEQLGINIPFISLNGALIQDKGAAVILNKSIIDKKYIIKAIKLAEKYYVKIALCYKDRIVYTEDNSVIKDFMTRFGTTYTLVDTYDNYLDNVLEIIMSGNDKRTIRLIHEKMILPFGLYLKFKFTHSQSYQDVYNLEILRKGVNKNTGLQILSKYLKIKKSEVMVFGDWYNDRDLFQFGGTNIALANAVEELKDMADYVTDKSNDDDGVGHFLKIFNESLN